MIKFFATALLLLSLTPVNATWNLEGLTYHNYCPPAAIREGLCKTGEDFAADNYTSGFKLPELAFPYVANQLTFDNGTAAMASVVRVPWTCWNKRLQRYSTCYSKYQLFADTTVCELSEINQCQITYEGEAWEPASIPSNGQWRDVTITFKNSDCK